MKKLLISLIILTTAPCKANLIWDAAQNIFISTARHMNPEKYNVMIKHCCFLKDLCINKETSKQAYEMLIKIYLNAQGTNQAQTLLKDLAETGFKAESFKR